MERILTALPGMRLEPRGWLRRLFAGLIARDEAYRQTRALAALDDRLREDIGLAPLSEAASTRWIAPVQMTLR